MRLPDLRAMELAGGLHSRASIIPAAAAPDHNHHRAGLNGMRWFQSLGADNVTVLPLIDRKSADDASLAEILRRSKLIYMLGGFPRYLGQTLKGSACWDAMTMAHRNGAVIAGSSAGAMVLCEYYYNPADCRVCEGLCLMPGICVLPHHNTFGQTCFS